MFGNRALYHDGWVAACLPRTAAVARPARSISTHDNWELYNVDEDFSEYTDLAAKEPQKLKQLQDLFMAEAGKYNVLPLDDRMRRARGPETSGPA